MKHQNFHFQLKHENHENHQNDLNFKAYVCHVQTIVYIHILNIMSPQKYIHKGTWLKDLHV